MTNTNEKGSLNSTTPARRADMGDRIWILGASDPEMAAVEALLVECGERVAHALNEHGERVHPGAADRGVCHRYVTDCGTAGSAETTWYLVECDVPTPSRAARVVIDHHRPGDPGYGRLPTEFLPASSIGQVIAELARLERLPRDWEEVSEGDCTSIVGSLAHRARGWAVTRGLRSAYGVPVWYGQAIPLAYVLLAAGDHCLAAAYRGECPGVHPDELMRHRAASRAAFQGRAVADVLADIEHAQAALRAAPKLCILGAADMPHTADHGWESVCDGCAVDEVYVADMRRPEPVAELVEAATRLDMPYMSGPLAQTDGRRKYTVSGSERVVRAWLDWAEREGLVDAYGDPARGFAGAYAP
jgi:hypothetical protein